MFSCENFNSNINLIDLINLRQIGDNFMHSCTNFNGNCNITSKNLSSIGKNFFACCNNLDCDILINALNLMDIGDGFLANCNNLNHKIDLSKCAKLKNFPTEHCIIAKNLIHFLFSLQNLAKLVMILCIVVTNTIKKSLFL